jgi:hypothetical protein
MNRYYIFYITNIFVDADTEIIKKYRQKYPFMKEQTIEESIKKASYLLGIHPRTKKKLHKKK